MKLCVYLDVLWLRSPLASFPCVLLLTEVLETKSCEWGMKFTFVKITSELLGLHMIKSTRKYQIFNVVCATSFSF